MLPAEVCLTITDHPFLLHIGYTSAYLFPFFSTYFPFYFVSTFAPLQFQCLNNSRYNSSSACVIISIVGCH
ncbi:hypothetical protein N431DRAFT_118926 [Stipitochalara longipes BDJ]|nr:hypothetical protein N431DRAFT_118926 [Stipitochalara longipes BDJ]